MRRELFGVENEHFVDEALRLVAKAEDQGIRLRILGSIAYRLHSPENIHLFSQLERALTDVDFAGERSQSREIRRFMKEEGYECDEGILVGSEGARHVYIHPKTHLNVDVFADELYFCHPIPLKGRLHLDYPTITTTDLLLEKMQIVEINLKDIKDALVLLLEHPVGEPSAGRENIDLDYIISILSGDWGFYYTVTTNLRRVADHLPQLTAVNAEQADRISSRIDTLLQSIEEAPKSLKWRIRAKLGTRKRWYQEVADKNAIY